MAKNRTELVVVLVALGLTIAALSLFALRS